MNAVMPQVSQENRDRIRSAIAVAAGHALLGYAFLTGLGYRIDSPMEAGLKLFDIAEEPLPPPAKPARPETARTKKAKPKDPEGAASPANLRNTPTDIVAPKPEIPLPVPPPVAAAPVAGQGSAPWAGAAPIPGPGTGSGGQGNGLGSGSQGDGTGGGGGGIGRHARWIRGGINGSDYPRSALKAHVGGTVFLRFVVAPDGRVGECAVTRSSGNAALDATTCRLIMSRFRYRPARDAAGRAVPDVIRGQHVWEVGPEPPPIDVEPDIPD
jgi:protein TonB